MNSFEEIIRRILELNSNWNKDFIRELIMNKVKSYSGFISEEGALRLIAQDLKIRLDNNEVNMEETIPIIRLTPGLSDVNVFGRVSIIWPLREFIKKNGEKGTLLKFQLIDCSGSVNCNIWNPTRETIKEFENLLGKPIQLLHARTKKGLIEKVEIHLGEKSSIDFSPKNKNIALPELQETFSKIKDLKESGKVVNIDCIVKTAPEILTFIKNEKIGKVLKMIVKDHTSEINLVAWDEQIDNLQDIKINDHLYIWNAKVKQGLNNLEIHVGKNTVIRKVSN